MFSENLINCQPENIFPSGNMETETITTSKNSGSAIQSGMPRKIKFNTRQILKMPVTNGHQTEYQQLDFLYPELMIG